MASRNLTFLLLCPTRECVSFERGLEAECPGSRVESFGTPAELEAQLASVPAGTPAITVFDTRSEGAWEALRWLKGSRFRHVPALVASSEAELQEAYDVGANSVATHAWWEDDFASTMRALSAFWVQTAKLPYVHS